MPLWLQAGLWGWLGGGALVIGAALGWGLKRRPWLVASVMAFGAGVLISALAFDLMDEAFRRGGFWPTAGGFASWPHSRSASWGNSDGYHPRRVFLVGSESLFLSDWRDADPDLLDLVCGRAPCARLHRQPASKPSATP